MLRNIKSENFETMLGKFSEVCTSETELCVEGAAATDGAVCIRKNHLMYMAI